MQSCIVSNLVNMTLSSQVEETVTLLISGAVRPHTPLICILHELKHTCYIYLYIWDPTCFHVLSLFGKVKMYM